MKFGLMAMLMAFALAAIGCSTTELDKAATAQNDANVQAITRQNEEATSILVKEGKIQPITAEARHEENESAKKLARKMARRAGNTDLPDLGEPPPK